MSHCIACGTAYSFTNTYKGNYCLDCHRSWLVEHPPSRVRSRPVGAGYRRSRRVGPAVRTPELPTTPDDDTDERRDDGPETPARRSNRRV